MSFRTKIDKITNSVEELKTGLSKETRVLPLPKHELKKITKKNGWKFNWRTEISEKNKLVYKLITENEQQIIQGLISISIEEGYIFMHLLESAPYNIGRNKKYMGVPANLVAYICRMSFEYGFEGEVAFDSKTALISHYQESLGAVLIYPPKRMAILTQQAKKLVNSYYKDFRR
jgi:DNA gyrase/topoisomerase IV subunit A